MNNLANGRENLQISSRGKTGKMTATEPSPLEKLNWLMHLQHVTGEIEACRDLIKQEIKKSDGKNEFAYFKQGKILREEGHIQEALDSFQMCMKLNPENTDNIKEVARCLFEMGRFRLALEAYLEAERITKNSDWQIFYNIGECYMQLEDKTNAKEYAQRAVHLGKQETAFALLIRILVSEGNLKAAALTSNAAIESCPDSVDMLTQSGILHLKLGQTQSAFEKLSSALALNPTSSRALLGVGCITQSHEEYDVALAKYKVAITKEPESIALWNNIGMCFHSKQKHIAAISCLKRALWISPMNWRVLYNLGLVHLSTHQPASAFNFLCAAVNLRPDVAQSFMVLGCALMELRDSENAARAFKQALSLDSADPMIVINTVLCLAISGARDEALELFQKFKNLPGKHINREVLALAEQLTSFFDNSGKSNRGGTADQAEDNSVPPEVCPDDNPDNGDIDGISGKENNINGEEFSSSDQSLRELDPDEV